MRGKPIGSDVDVTILAKATPGFVGADIENPVNEAALLAARRNKKIIGMSEFQEAIERVQLGPERKSRIMSLKKSEITAYHEAGHAPGQPSSATCPGHPQDHHNSPRDGRWRHLVPGRRYRTSTAAPSLRR